jgi:hypothetical protein
MVRNPLDAFREISTGVEITHTKKRQRNSHIFLLKKRERKLDIHLVLESD